jgi:hypothetical protein
MNDKAANKINETHLRHTQETLYSLSNSLVVQYAKYTIFGTVYTPTEQLEILIIRTSALPRSNAAVLVAHNVTPHTFV